MSDMIDRDAVLAILTPAPNAKNGLWANRMRKLHGQVAALPAEDVRAALSIVNKYAEAWADRDINGSSIRVIADEIAKLQPTEDVRAGALTVAQAAQVLLDAMTARPQLADPFDACDVEVERLAIEYSSQGGDAVMVLETAEKFMLAGLRALIPGAKP